MLYPNAIQCIPMLYPIDIPKPFGSTTDVSGAAGEQHVRTSGLATSVEDVFQRLGQKILVGFPWKNGDSWKTIGKPIGKP